MSRVCPSFTQHRSSVTIHENRDGWNTLPKRRGETGFRPKDAVFAEILIFLADYLQISKRIPSVTFLAQTLWCLLSPKSVTFDLWGVKVT